MTIIHNVSVDFINRDSIQVVNFVQHDQNIPVLSVDLYSGGSKLEVDLSSAKIYLRVSLPNGAFADIESTETSGDGPKSGKISTVTFGLGYNVFPAYGAAKAIVLITEKATGSTEYTNRAGSSPIVFMIDKDPIQDGSEESLDQYYGLRGYIEDVSENVVKKTALSIPKEGEYTTGKSWSYAPQVIIDRKGVVKRQKWFPTDNPSTGQPNELSTDSGGSFVRRDGSKNILVPWKHKSASGVETTDYVPAVSGKEVDSKIDSAISSENASILNPLLEGLANPYIFALQENVYSSGAYSRFYIHKNNGEEIEYSVGNDPCVFAGVTSVGFKNDGDTQISITFVMNGTSTTITLQAYGSSHYLETVTLSGNMTVLAVNK